MHSVLIFLFMENVHNGIAIPEVVNFCEFPDPDHEMVLLYGKLKRPRNCMGMFSLSGLKRPDHFNTNMTSLLQREQ